jgi:uncharacterized Zn finger protein (UPF0148 family)
MFIRGYQGNIICPVCYKWFSGFRKKKKNKEKNLQIQFCMLINYNAYPLMQHKNNNLMLIDGHHSRS